MNNLVDDFTRYPQHGVPPNIAPFFFNEFWLLRDKLIGINETVLDHIESSGAVRAFAAVCDKKMFYDGRRSRECLALTVASLLDKELVQDSKMATFGFKLYFHVCNVFEFREIVK